MVQTVSYSTVGGGGYCSVLIKISPCVVEDFKAVEKTINGDHWWSPTQSVFNNKQMRLENSCYLSPEISGYAYAENKESVCLSLITCFWWQGDLCVYPAQALRIPELRSNKTSVCLFSVQPLMGLIAHHILVISTKVFFPPVFSVCTLTLPLHSAVNKDEERLIKYIILQRGGREDEDKYTV